MNLRRYKNQITCLLFLSLVLCFFVPSYFVNADYLKADIVVLDSDVPNIDFTNDGFEFEVTSSTSVADLFFQFGTPLSATILNHIPGDIESWIVSRGSADSYFASDFIPTYFFRSDRAFIYLSPDFFGSRTNGFVSIDSHSGQISSISGLSPFIGYISGGLSYFLNPTRGDLVHYSNGVLSGYSYTPASLFSSSSSRRLSTSNAEVSLLVTANNYQSFLLEIDFTNNSVYYYPDTDLVFIPSDPSNPYHVISFSGVGFASEYDDNLDDSFNRAVLMPGGYVNTYFREPNRSFGLVPFTSTLVDVPSGGIVSPSPTPTPGSGESDPEPSPSPSPGVLPPLPTNIPNFPHGKPYTSLVHNDDGTTSQIPDINYTLYDVSNWTYGNNSRFQFSSNGSTLPAKVFFCKNGSFGTYPNNFQFTKDSYGIVALPAGWDVTSVLSDDPGDSSGDINVNVEVNVTPSIEVNVTPKIEVVVTPEIHLTLPPSYEDQFYNSIPSDNFSNDPSDLFNDVDTTISGRGTYLFVVSVFNSLFGFFNQLGGFAWLTTILAFCLISFALGHGHKDG